MQTNIKNDKPKLELKNIFKELLKDEKALKGFEKSANKTNILLGSIAGAFLVYIILFSVEKMKTLNKLETQLLSIKTDKSIYEVKSLIKKYKKFEKNSQKLKKELKDTLTQKNLKKLTFQNNSITVKFYE